MTELPHKKGTIIPAVITVYTDRNILFCDQKTSGCRNDQKMMKKEKGSAKPGKKSSEH